MKTIKTAILAAAILAYFAPISFSQNPKRLSLGDAAPALDVEFVKGAPVTLSEGAGGNVYVVEFWATWCPPCRESVPHLTEIQQKFKDRGLTVIGISNEEAAEVKPYVEKRGKDMEYTVAVDRENQTIISYLAGFGIDGIPTAFLIDKSGRIVWHGHPMDPELEVRIAKLVGAEGSDSNADGSGGAKASEAKSKTSNRSTGSDSKSSTPKRRSSGGSSTK